MVTSTSSPFGADPPVELPLARAPLKAVLVQLRFPQLAILRDPEKARIFPERIAEEYPLLNEGKEVEFTLGPEGAVASEGSLAFQSQTIDGAWTVSLSASSLSIATTKYISRTDLCERVEYLVGVLRNVVGRLPRTERIGVRFINLLSEEVFNSIGDHLQSQLIPGYGFPGDPEEPVGISQAVTHIVFNGNAWSLQVRSGLLSPGALLDGSIPPTTKTTWVFDLDSNTTEPVEIQSDAIGQAVRVLAGRAYRFFRWSVTEEFLKVHGAQELT